MLVTKHNTHLWDYETVLEPRKQSYEYLGPQEL
jgi:hypothetical protein